ncbi:MAG: MFS transporter [Solirubrobacteraceae bacterium]
MNVPEPERPGRRVLAPLYAAGFVTAFGAHAVAANLGGYGTKHHTSLWELGLLLGVYDAAEVVLKPVFGSLSDRIGAKPVMLGGLFAFALASAVFVVAGQVHWLGVARFAQGAAAAAFSPAAGAALASLGGRKRTGRLFGGYGGAKSIGYLAGPIAGGALVNAGGYSLLFIVLAALAGAVAVLVSGRFPPSLRYRGRDRRSLPWPAVSPTRASSSPFSSSPSAPPPCRPVSGIYQSSAPATTSARSRLALSFP